MKDRIITFQSYSDAMLAEIIRARLADSGIECYIADGNTIGANPLFNNTLGGVKIKIFEHDLEKCKAILAQHEELQVEDIAPEDAKTTCPYCGSTNVRYDTATVTKTNWLGAIISFLTTTYPIVARKAWHCFNCGMDFD